MQCMMTSMILLQSAASEKVLAAGGTPVAEAASAPAWPLIAVLGIAILLAWQPRKDAPKPPKR